MNIYFELFGIFFKIGAFTIGGGYAMVPLIENEIVTKRKWIAREDFIDLLAIAQSSPGVLAVNIAIFIGYKLRGVRGSIVTTLGTVLPSFTIILAIALFFHNFKDNPVVERIFKGIRPAVVALIAAPTFTMAKAARINRYTIWIPVLSALLIWLLGFSPIWIIIAAGLGGFAWGKIKRREPDGGEQRGKRDETKTMNKESYRLRNRKNKGSYDLLAAVLHIFQNRSFRIRRRLRHAFDDSG